MGRNYHAHIAELNNKAPPEPMWFDKPMSSLLLPGESLKWLPQYKDIHHEIELGVVIGKGGKDISEEESMDHVDKHDLIILRDVTSDHTLLYDDRDQVLLTKKGRLEAHICTVQIM